MTQRYPRFGYPPKKADFCCMNMRKFMSSVSLDCVVFGFHEVELKVLLLRLKELEQWSLPGGFIDLEVDVDTAARAVLQDRTGLTDIFLQQFHVFGRADRSGTAHIDALMAKGLMPAAAKSWFSQRFVSIGYYALVEYSKVRVPRPDAVSEAAEWVSLQDLPPLILDHQQIISCAYAHLKQALQHQPVGLNLLPDEFTMPELQALYETILQRSLDRRNFRRRMLGYGILEDTGMRRTGRGHKSPILYRFAQARYTELLEAGFQSSGLFK
jgi:8-oxo-dGTP diphosphatase